MATGSTSSDREVLLLFKRRTSGEDFWANRDGWNANVTDLNSWFGVTAAANGRVVKFDLSTDLKHFIKEDVPRLAGCIPVELVQLNNLQELNLSSNQLTGDVPVELAQMSNLQHLHLGGNKLTGDIPVELAQMSNLQHLDLCSNQLIGDIPVELAQMSNLQHLDLCSNQLIGDIPVQLAQMSNLKHLGLGGNQLTGDIPVQLAQMSNLKHLDLGGNQLTGLAESDLQNPRESKTLYIIGDIPVELAQMSNLQQLHLGGNQLTGDIPVELAQMSNLQHLDLRKTQLTGDIPVELAQMSNLQQLHLGGNQLTGDIPIVLAQMSNLQHLNLWGNEFTGDIPVELVQMSNLKYLGLGGNQLTGDIPVELAQMSNLQHLDLWSNQLIGDIPVDLAQISNLQYLDLRQNQLTGDIPVALAQMSNLQHLDLGGNQLTGDIPVELAQMSNLQHLDLWSNQLTGDIPVDLAQMSNLQYLALGDNQLTGDIPVELAQMSNLKHLGLGGNQLTGFGGVEDALKLTIYFLSIKHHGPRFIVIVPEVRLSDNPWRMPPEAVVEQGLEAVKTYLNDVKDAKDTGSPIRSLQQLKVVLVGSSRAGKTSLIKSIINGRAVPTEGEPEEASTVGIELQPHDFGNTKVEFYDCGGQLDYAGMHQTFLSKRALYLLVWDVTTCQNLSATSDFDEVIREKIMPWLTILNLRAPKATVMLVANKCDGVIEDYSEIADRVEQRARFLLDQWQRLRGLDGRGRQYIANLSLLSGRHLISCQDYAGISELVQHISDFGSASIEVPPSWNLALTVVNALRKNDPPTTAARRHLELSAMPSNTERKGKWVHTYVTRQELSQEWQSVVRWVKSKLEARTGTEALCNQDSVRNGELASLSSPESAIEGALWISEFAGHIIRFDGGEGIFLDVVWLSQVLSPILSHKLSSECRPPSAALCASKADLLNKGILRVDFARYLWRDALDSSTVEAYDGIVNGFYRVLLKLGVILPLGYTTLLGIDGHIPGVPFENEDTPQDVLVVMRLPDTDERISGERLQARAKVLEGAREVTLKWRFDSAGAPFGLVERLIASCHRIGEVEMKLCWRFGAFFKSHVIVQTNQQYTRLFTFMIRYDVVNAPYEPGEDNSPEHVLLLRVNGPLEDERVWIALRYVASAMAILSEEWPGVLWEGWSQCPNHLNGVMYLAPPREARIGGPLLPQLAHAAPSRGCDCSLGENTVQGLVLRRLGNTIDTRKGDPFANTLSTRDISAPNTLPGLGSGRVSAPCSTSAPHTPSNSSNMTGGVSTEHWELSYFHAAVEIWRENAWYFAGSLGSLALAIFLGVTFVGIVEGMEALWMTSSILVGILALGAIISSALACRDSIESRRRNSQTATGSPLQSIV